MDIDRIKTIIGRLNAELAAGTTDYAALGRSIAEYGAMLVDAAEGRDPSRRPGIGAKRGSTTRKVRRALGYTCP